MGIWGIHGDGKKQNKEKKGVDSLQFGNALGISEE